MIQRILPALALLLALGACKSVTAIGPLAPGGEHDVGAISLTITATTPNTVSVAVIERRPYVVAGDEPEKFLGTERGAWSQTVDITTLSGGPLAVDLTSSVTDALTRNGVVATALNLPRGTTPEAALAAFQAVGTDRLLEVSLDEWRTDSYTRVHLKWRLEANVYDRTGAKLGRSDTQGNSPVGTTLASDDSNIMTIRELSRKMSNLLNDPGVTRGLR